MRLFRSQSGFTLIEMIVSLAIFGIVVTVSVGALLVLVGTNQRLQGEQRIMTNLSFALDSMTREIRTGSAYWCFTSSNNNQYTNNGNLDSILNKTAVLDCANGHGNNANAWNFHGMAFLEGGDSISGTVDNRILYFYDKPNKTIYRRVGTTKQAIVSSEINVIDVDFFVTGSEDLNTDPASDTLTDIKQPTVTIYIRASENADGSGKQFEVQTTVTQRTLDV
ncbi:MAG: type II secretion system protein [Patescibacteria group bacterium]